MATSEDLREACDGASLPQAATGEPDTYRAGTVSGEGKERRRRLDIEGWASTLQKPLSDDGLKVKLVDEAHKRPSTACPGKTRTKLLVKARYY